MSDLTSWWQMPGGKAKVSNIFINVKQVLFLGETSPKDCVKTIKSRYISHITEVLDLYIYRASAVRKPVECSEHSEMGKFTSKIVVTFLAKRQTKINLNVLRYAIRQCCESSSISHLLKVSVIKS